MCFFPHNDFKQKRTHNETSMNAIYNDLICYTLSISSTPSKSSTPTRPRTSKSFLLHESEVYARFLLFIHMLIDNNENVALLNCCKVCRTSEGTIDFKRNIIPITLDTLMLI